LVDAVFAGAAGAVYRVLQLSAATAIVLRRLSPVVDALEAAL
jgi:hypothetical protein